MITKRCQDLSNLLFAQEKGKNKLKNYVPLHDKYISLGLTRKNKSERKDRKKGVVVNFVLGFAHDKSQKIFRPILLLHEHMRAYKKLILDLKIAHSVLTRNQKMYFKETNL